MSYHSGSGGSPPPPSAAHACARPLTFVSLLVTWSHCWSHCPTFGHIGANDAPAVRACARPLNFGHMVSLSVTSERTLRFGGLADRAESYLEGPEERLQAWLRRRRWIFDPRGPAIDANEQRTLLRHPAAQ
eukprot:1183310-Prorocentrum_minimum.AAC.3